MKMLFLTGMFRSGTTTLARALNAHSAIACAADPIIELFKALRSEVALEIGQDRAVAAPLEDYYFDHDGQRLFTQIMEQATFDRPVKVWDWEHRLDSLVSRCSVYSGQLAPYLRGIKGETYREILDSVLQAIAKVYGTSNTTITCFKEVWTTEFIPALARTYPDVRFIVMVRDPRAVCASKNIQNKKYPWLFLTRQWRKLASLNSILQTMPELEGKVLEISQEEFIRYPTRTTKRLCAFVGLSWEPGMADPEAFTDGDGEPWRQNTAFGDGKVGFDEAALDRWRKTLTEEEVKFINMICGPEMYLKGYLNEKPCSWRPHSAMLLNSPRIEDTEQEEWMREFVPNDPMHTTRKLSEEFIRAALLNLNAQERQTVPEELIKAAFLSRGVMDDIAARADC